MTSPLFRHLSLKSSIANATYLDPPSVLGVDVMDVSGEHEHDVDHNIFKARLDPKGNKITEEKGSAYGFIRGTLLCQLLALSDNGHTSSIKTIQ